jgi:hypothetical protein
MAFLILIAILAVLLIMALLALAMRDSYDGLSFIFLGILVGFALAVIFLGGSLFV